MIEKIREATKLLIGNFTLFSSIVLTVWLPGSILLVYLRLYVLPEATGGDELRMIAQEFRVSNTIELAFGPLYTGALLYAISQLKQGLKPTYGESMSQGARRSFKLFWARFSTGLIILGGFIALIIPGVILSLRFALLDSIVVLEGLEGGKARNLSAKLTRGKRWNILGTIILAFSWVMVTIILATFVLYLPLSFVGQDENFVIAVISECIYSILLLIPNIVLFLFYWNAKEQQAAFDDEGNS